MEGSCVEVGRWWYGDKILACSGLLLHKGEGYTASKIGRKPGNFDSMSLPQSCSKTNNARIQREHIPSHTAVYVSLESDESQKSTSVRQRRTIAVQFVASVEPYVTRSR